MEPVGGFVLTPPVAAEQAIEAETAVGEPPQRGLLLGPRVPARPFERDEALAPPLPGETVAGEQQVVVDQVEHAAFGVTRHREGDDVGAEFDRLAALLTGGSGGAATV